MAKEKELTFEESMGALETIVKELEQGDVPLEKALEQFQKGIELSKVCQETLTKAEKTLTKIMTENDEAVVFEEGEG
ncbi:exodeoxyribonuclease VII small subunit [Vagococcus salmoninarum]|uniref:Exodeoxyribonuclease 7 small subunit n=1 Tax=Vagococcus salmoninarum TaxID=2739 RepID=A0A429ZLJ5_9ENTE|nr:exodeoxyribonuclease VII small subunit [Vagococcus salmoninarum]MBE9388786.1 exodeoxyribonuclease VII small subunit [Vagococcus salmoninarum]RST94543.1 exodeoxyribonuclease VII small subunit [Vagococcus salmoninarum]